MASANPLDHMIIKYLQSQGYFSTARIFRRDASSGKDDVETSHSLKEMYDDYQDSPAAADAAFAVMQANAPKDLELGALRGGGKAATDGSSSATLLRGAASVIDSSECPRTFMGNLPFKITEELLAEAFADCGPIESVQWITDKETGNFYGTAFVVFETLEGAKAAVAATGREILQRKLKINFAPMKEKRAEAGEKRAMPPAPKLHDKPEGCRTLFIGNLGFTISEDMVRNFFSGCGEVYQVRQLQQIRRYITFNGGKIIVFKYIALLDICPAKFTLIGTGYENRMSCLRTPLTLYSHCLFVRSSIGSLPEA